MYRALTSFTTNNYQVKLNEILEDDFTTENEIEEFLRINYIEVYDGTLDITENGTYDVEDYLKADVNVSGGSPTLPYQQLEYIQSTGAQYIDTGIKINTGYKAFIDLKLVNSGANYYIIGGMSPYVRSYLGAYNNTTLLGVNSDVNSSINLQNDTKYNIEVYTKSGNGYLILNNDITATTNNTYTSLSDINIFLFTENYNNAGTLGVMKGNIYSCKIYNSSNELVRDFIPVIRKSDNEICVYDKVSQQFFTNAGLGSFVAGEEI